VPWATLSAALAGCAALVAWQATRTATAVELAPWLRVVAVVCAAVAATCVEDPGEVSTVATPVGRLRRRLLGAGLPSGVLAAGWLAIAGMALVIVEARDVESGSPPLPVAALALEMVAGIAVGLAVGVAVAALSGPRGAGPRAALLTISLAMFSVAVPQTMRWLWALPGWEPAFSDARLHWAIVGSVAAMIFVALGADPARRSPVTSLPRRTR
jgi:hypothetical protein